MVGVRIDEVAYRLGGGHARPPKESRRHGCPDLTDNHPRVADSLGATGCARGEYSQVGHRISTGWRSRGTATAATAASTTSGKQHKGEGTHCRALSNSESAADIFVHKFAISERAVTVLLTRREILWPVPEWLPLCPFALALFDG